MPEPTPPAPIVLLTKPISMMASATLAGGLSAQILWVDATGNAEWLNTVEKVQDVVDHCKAAGINSIVVDIKPLSGQVLYNSRYAPRMADWKGTPYPADFDVLRAFLDAGSRAAIPVYVSINTFAEGHKSFHVGPAYSHKDWQIVSYETVPYVTGPNGENRFPLSRENEPPARDELAAYTQASGPDRPVKPDEAYAAYDSQDKVALIADGSTLPATDRIPIPKDGGLLVGRGTGKDWILQNLKVDVPVRFTGDSRLLPGEDSRSDRYAVFVNPILPDVRRRILDVIREILKNYPVSGIFLDRMRYPNLHADFSETSRREFEKWLGKRVERWPEDIVTFMPRPGADPVRGPLFNPWIEWRAHNIHDFLAEARQVIETTRRNTQVGVYVGSWYSVYFDVGVNWGSPAFPDRYDWMSPTYPQTGYAPLLDLICSGTYYPTAWKSQAKAVGADPGATVEGSAEEALAAVRDETVMYGSLYLIQYEHNPEAFRQAIRASLAATGGVMLFDLSYIHDYNWWSILDEELPKGKTPPHRVQSFVDSLRTARHSADSASGATERGKTLVAPTDHPPL